MKIRTGFVSNSSSSSFILDKRDLTADELKEIMSMPTACGVGRGTAKAIGKVAVNYANDWIEDCGKCYEEHNGLGHWILEWAEKLEDNIVFVRKSDEDDYDYFNGIEETCRNKAKAEMEYH